MVPTTAPVSRQTMTASGQDQPCRVAATPMIAAATPAVQPADRSISPSSRTKTRPIAMTITAAAWLIRLAMLNALVNVCGRRIEKTMNSTTRPRTAGSEPTSPPRTRAM